MLFIGWRHYQTVLLSKQGRPSSYCDCVSINEMITDFLWSEIEDMDLDDLWFKQKGATCETVNETMTLCARNAMTVLSHVAMLIGRHDHVI